MGKIAFFVAGKPIAQGSAKWIPSATTGKSIPIVNKNLKPWRNTVALFAAQALAGRRAVGGVSLTLLFTLERPKCHYRTGKFSHLLKDDAPERHLQKPDPDKLARAILDALTGVAYGDDCEVDTFGAHKQWGPRGDGSGVHITMRGVFHAVQR